jgi:D-alanine-D-alanine ligase
MIKVGVIRGGVSSEYEVSLKTGSNVLSHLRSDKLNKKYKAIDILIDKDGTWHISGKPVSISDVFHSVDVIFNALHGDFGEDGKVQQILDQWKIPYTGSSAFASSLGYNKVLAKEQFLKLGIKTPNYLAIPKYENEDGVIDSYSMSISKKIHDKLSPPWILKPLSGGSSVGMRICKTYVDLVNAFLEGINMDTDILVEEVIEGKEATVGVIDNFRDRKIYVLPSVEIQIPKEKDFFDYEAKYVSAEYICPGNFSNLEKEELSRLAGLIHTGLNLDHYSRSDFIVHKKKGIYALEVNTLPGLTDHSLIPRMLNAVGSNVPAFIDHIITLALYKVE